MKLWLEKEPGTHKLFAYLKAFGSLLTAITPAHIYQKKHLFALKYNYLEALFNLFHNSSYCNHRRRPFSNTRKERKRAKTAYCQTRHS